MTTLFDPSSRETVLARVDSLRADSVRQWGKMTVSQMLAHCSAALEVATGDTPRRQQWIGKIFAPFVRTKLLGEAPFSRNSPTDPTFVIRDDRDFAAERRRLVGLVNRFAEQGPESAGRQTHSFLGSMRGDEWGIMMLKHLDHHLRQFGA